MPERGDVDASKAMRERAFSNQEVTAENALPMVDSCLTSEGRGMENRASEAGLNFWPGGRAETLSSVKWSGSLLKLPKFIRDVVT